MEKCNINEFLQCKTRKISIKPKVFNNQNKHSSDGWSLYKNVKFKDLYSC